MSKIPRNALVAALLAVLATPLLATPVVAVMPTTIEYGLIAAGIG